MKAKIIIVFVLLGSACFQNIDTTISSFEDYIQLANASEKEGNYKDAEKYYLAAMDVAQKSDWIDGVVTAKSNLGAVYMAQKKTGDAERSFIEAKNLCKPRLCKGLENLYDQLIFFYLFNLKDAAKAEINIVEILSNPEFLPIGSDMNTKVKKYVDEMKTAGFADESNLIETKFHIYK